MPGIGLMMIVKDEAPVIRRCLDSVRPFVDWWVVADTGSSDGTQELVREALRDLPGELVERPWVDFGQNRQEVLDLARLSPHRGPDDYALWIDADEQLRGIPPRRPDLAADGYHLQVAYDATRYARLCLVRLAAPWRWRGPIHEYLDLPGASLGSLAAPTVLVSHDGARAGDPDTYRKDAGLIERALRDDPDDPRLQFYLAQSWRDAGELERALAAYAVRAANPAGWDQERWQALFQAARLRERLGEPAAAVIDAHLAAYQHCPWRAEPLVEAARLERSRERYEIALLYARTAAALPQPGGEGLFVDTETYAWRAWDEVAVSAYWTGRYDEGLAAARRALAARPDDERLRANVTWCEQGLAG
ncbi:glycosyltransferase [Nocardioides sp. BYT-33-1]|uniref:glycosyltransferase n=1 Tax=Nocardioides sp. BYT-33-1 TaxID=3416952 RepID=UPI003F52DB82